MTTSGPPTSGDGAQRAAHVRCFCCFYVQLVVALITQTGRWFYAHIHTQYTCCTVPAAIRIIMEMVWRSSHQALGALTFLPPPHLLMLFMKEIFNALLMPSSLVLFATINAYKTYCCQPASCVPLWRSRKFSNQIGSVRDICNCAHWR